MRAMSDYTRMDPRKRIQKLLDFNQRLHRTPESADVFKEWDFHLDTKLVELDGRILKNENIVFNNNQKYVCVCAYCLGIGHFVIVLRIS